MAGDRIVIVKKKKVTGGGHHGGSWKVAYADFVTAMMAFFLVMWIMGMDQGVKDLVQGYFNNPIGFRKSFSGGANPISAGNAIQNIGLQRTAVISREAQASQFEEAATDLEAQLQDAGLLHGLGADVEIELTNEGLRIDMMETGSQATFFEQSSAELQPTLLEVLASISAILVDVPNPVVVEGHTDALPFRRGVAYSNWELSVDRANAARRVLLAESLPAERISEVRGYAARQLKNPDNPLDPRNRRISLLIPFMEAQVEFTASDLERMLVEGEPDLALLEGDRDGTTPDLPPSGPAGGGS